MSTPDDSPPLSAGICIPVLNEAASLEQLLRSLERLLDEAACSYTICLVDHGSTDGSLAIIGEFTGRNARIKLINAQKTGKGCQRGAASRAGLQYLVEHTDHEVFADLDADGAQDPGEMLNGLRQISPLRCDVAIASKYVRGSRVIGRPVLRRAVSRSYSMLARVLFSSNLRDFSNSYRFYSRKAAMLTLAREPRFTGPLYLLEMLLTWLEHDLAILEVPTQYIERKRGHSKVSLSDLAQGLLGLLWLGCTYRSSR